MTNALNLVAPVDTLAMDFTRDFDAPVDALFRRTPTPSWSSSGWDRRATKCPSSVGISALAGAIAICTSGPTATNTGSTASSTWSGTTTS